MALLEFLKLALFAITRNKMRAFLTMLGIIVGVGAVIAMIGIGEGSKRASIALIQNMGSNMLTIFPGSGGNRFGPTAMGVPTSCWKAIFPSSSRNSARAAWSLPPSRSRPRGW